MQSILEMSLFNARALIMFLQVSSHSPNQVQPWKDDRCLYVFVTADICSICVVRQTFLLVLAVIKEEKKEE